MGSLLNQPPENSVDTKGGAVNQGWAQFFSSLRDIVNALTTNGTTLKRPVTFLWVGRPYFDTTLGYPIWYDGTGWVDATGAPA